VHPNEAREVDVGRSTLKSIKDRILSGDKINFNTKDVKNLVAFF